MCEFLINALDAINPSPMAYQKGDLFECYTNGTFAAESAVNPHWIAVVVPDMTLEEGRSLCVSQESMDIASGEQIMTIRRRFFCVENIAPDNVDRFYDCVQRRAPYTTDRLSFLSYAVEDKL